MEHLKSYTLGRVWSTTEVKDSCDLKWREKTMGEGSWEAEWPSSCRPPSPDWVRRNKGSQAKQVEFQVREDKKGLSVEGRTNWKRKKDKEHVDVGAVCSPRLGSERGPGELPPQERLGTHG